MFANSKKQTLAMHSIGVANIALELYLKLNFKQSSMKKKTIENIDAFKKSIFFAGLFHDIGKIDPNFQEFINKKDVTDANGEAVDGVHFIEKKETEKFSFLNYPRHNEVSWALSTQLLENDKSAQYAIYYHHAKVERQIKGKPSPSWTAKNILNMVFSDDSIRSFCQKFLSDIAVYPKSLHEMKDIFDELSGVLSSLSVEKNETHSPGFLFSGVLENEYQGKKIAEKDLEQIKNLLVRSLVVSADRIISSLSVEQLTECVENNEWDYICSELNSTENSLSQSIENMLDSFAVKNESNPENRTRDKEQKEIAHNLSINKNISTLFGPAGCGKTKIFLEWYRNKSLSNIDDRNKKLFIIAPRKMICSSLFNELRKNYIPSAKIELLTGDDKLYWDGESVSIINEGVKVESEVTITTIDQLISIMLSHKKIDMLLEFLNSYVIFDEFHEFFNIDGIVILFKFFIKLKQMLGDKDAGNDSKTLLVSATPNYYFLESILGINIQDSLQYIDTFNKEKFLFSFSKYEIEQGDKNQLEKSILFNTQKPGTIVIFNTATASQKSTIKVSGEDVLNFHSKFTPGDKKEIYQEIIKNWKNKDPASPKVLRAGPIVQASLNISTMDLITQVCSAENWCQRVGRANRFASRTNKAKVITVLSDKTLKGELTNNTEMRFLDKIAAKEQTFAWINYFSFRNFIENNLECEMTLSSLYEQYKDFHLMQETKQAYENDFDKTIQNSFKIFLNNDFTPIEYWKPVKKSKIAKMSSKSIRGKSVYVLPVRYDIYDKKIGDWLYLPSESLHPSQLLTLSETELNGKDALFNIQINILSTTKINGFSSATYETMKNYKSMNNFKIKIEAKNSTSPLLLSYTSSVPNYQTNNQSGLFYVTKGKVKIGLYAMSI